MFAYPSDCGIAYLQVMHPVRHLGRFALLRTSGAVIFVVRTRAVEMLWCQFCIAQDLDCRFYLLLKPSVTLSCTASMATRSIEQVDASVKLDFRCSLGLFDYPFTASRFSIV